YLYWIKDYIRFNNYEHPQNLTEKDVSDYLTHLAVTRNVSISTQKIALNAIVFLYKRIIKNPLGQLTDIQRSKKPVKLPTVFTRDEINNIFTHLSGEYAVKALAHPCASYTHVMNKGANAVKSPLDNL
ncbi:MAG: phage integrase N-terminal SAM-like domain-containing protein, partial [Kangiellaceae bacterium]|nr:phage integrase N-terminal SAM-like domain-containing protein [Kangiellaceae bacterium]